MDDRDKWRERVGEIWASSTALWWQWSIYIYVDMMSSKSISTEVVFSETEMNEILTLFKIVPFAYNMFRPVTFSIGQSTYESSIFIYCEAMVLYFF